MFLSSTMDTLNVLNSNRARFCAKNAISAKGRLYQGPFFFCVLFICLYFSDCDSDVQIQNKPRVSIYFYLNVILFVCAFTFPTCICMGLYCVYLWFYKSSYFILIFASAYTCWQREFREKKERAQYEWKSLTAIQNW